jgi:hypothetical protein
VGSSAQAGAVVAAAVAEADVVVAPRPAVGRHHHDHEPVGAGRAAQLGEPGDVVVEVLDHIQAGDRGDAPAPHRQGLGDGLGEGRAGSLGGGQLERQRVELEADGWPARLPEPLEQAAGAGAHVEDGALHAVAVEHVEHQQVLGPEPPVLALHARHRLDGVGGHGVGPSEAVADLGVEAAPDAPRRARHVDPVADRPNPAGGHVRPPDGQRRDRQARPLGPGEHLHVEREALGDQRLEHDLAARPRTP